jgi:Methyltransferase domain
MRKKTISDAYRAQQQDLHANPAYGMVSVIMAPLVAKLMKEGSFREILDYGAGKGRLGARLGELLDPAPVVHHYDPAIPEWAAPPEPCEFVACIDVLEHIEPDFLDNVLDDLKILVQRTGLFTVHTEPAAKFLDDGRNAHLIQKPYDWWLRKLVERFELFAFQRSSDGFFVIVTRKQ